MREIATNNLTNASKAPTIPKELLDWLKKKYPLRIPDIEWTERELWAYVGQQEIVAHLEKEFARQNP